jgi:O-antigen/teichoic acid export membrane protein
VEEFGVWLTVQAMLAFGTVLSFGYKTYLEFEFLKLGEKDAGRLALLLYSGIPVVLMLATLETLILYALIQIGAIGQLISPDVALSSSMVDDAGRLLLIQSVNWLLCVCTPGLVQRALVPLGYYPRNAWWYVAGSLISTLAAAAAVVRGASFLETGIVQAIAYLVFATALSMCLWSILKKENLRPIKPDLAFGIRSVLPSLALAAKTLLGMVQQQGIRVLLAGSLGLRELAGFASMRTISNVALQGIGTVVNPLTPELLRFANAKDSDRVQATFGVIWVLTVVMLSFCLIVLQLIAPRLFSAWTLGKISFDPLVFAGLSAALLVFGLSQPVLTIVRGSNQLRAQLVATVCGALLVVTAIYFLTKSFGLLAPTLGIVLSELISFLIYARAARIWMADRQLVWPKAMFNLVLAFAMVGIMGIFITAIAHQYAAVIALGVLVVQILIAAGIWRTLPPIVVHRVLSFISRLRPLK